MATDDGLKLQFAKVIVAPVLWLFAVPAATLAFLAIATPKMRFRSYAEQFHQVHDIAGKATIKLRKLGNQAEALKAAFSHYWSRDQAARAYLSSNSA